ncbi:tyrosine-type recombinase/integrase [Bifidobacterium stellenboschense]|uniref:Site-specific recombinase, phage integrase family n=1 Tax=Bifidobacterium stellenboschense TaxID=762211 RepID=A0A087DQR7_9BIFI|nr:site-specific integrase [Bifidobacterium stellenboschense]KFI97867.1 site-specific recombinase, phage integrase family [Bifidobacterium stellenboschense]
MPKRFGAIRFKPNKTTPKYIEASYITPAWAFSEWPGLKERQYANFDPDDEDGARAWLRKARISIEAGSWQPESETRRDQVRKSITLATYFDQWITTRRTKQGTPLEAGTLYRIRKDAENHILPYFGRMRLTDITTSDIDRWWAGLDHTQTAMCINALKTLKAILNSAAAPGRDGETPLIAENPCRITTPRHRRDHETIPATIDQVKTIHDAMPERYAPAVYLSLFCNGLRIGEVCALRRRDIDLKNLTLHIRASRKTMDKTALTGKPKTANSVRDEAIPPQFAPLLNDLLDQIPDDPDAFVFPAIRHPDQPLHPNTLRKWFKTARETAGRPDLRFHDLRHTALTLLAEHGATLKELMAAAGHSDPETAMRYQHATQTRTRALARQIGQLIPTTDTTPTDTDDNGDEITRLKRRLAALAAENQRLTQQLNQQ